MRRALAAAIAAVALAATPIIAATFTLDGGSMTAFRVPIELPVRVASLDVKPESLEKRSVGTPVTAFIEATRDVLDVRDIDRTSIRLCLAGPLCEDGAPADGKPKVDDADRDGVPDLKVTFERADVLALVAEIPAPSVVTLTVSGVLGDGTAFTCNDTIRLVDPEPTAEPAPATEPEPTAEPVPAATPEPTSEPTPEPTPEPSADPAAEPAPPATPEATLEPAAEA